MLKAILFFVLWILATVVGWLIGTVLSQTIIADLVAVFAMGGMLQAGGPTFQTNPTAAYGNVLAALTIWRAVNWSFLGAPIIGLQFLILMLRVKWAEQWVLSILGWAAGGAFVSVMVFAQSSESFRDPFSLTAATTGLAVGTVQWLILRRQFHLAIVWLPASVLSFWLGQYAGSQVAINVLHRLGLPLTLYRLMDPTMIEYDLVVGFVEGIVAGVATGFIWLVLEINPKTKIVETAL